MIDPDYAVFAAIVEAGSLSAAGRRLGISPAQVSKRLAHLETRLGARLVHRTTRRLALTEAGTRFHADVVAILGHIRRAEERVSGTVREPGGALRVSMPTSFARLHIAPRLIDFLDAHPRVQLEVQLSDTFVDLMADRIDVAVRITATVPINLAAVRLATSRRILCASPGYLARHGTPQAIADLGDHHLLAAEGQMPWRLVRGRARAAVERPSRVRTNSSEVVRELATAGAGIALRSLWDVGAALEAGALVRVLSDWEGSADAGIYAVRHDDTMPTPAVTAFIAWLRDRLDPPPWRAQDA